MVDDGENSCRGRDRVNKMGTAVVMVLIGVTRYGN